MSGNFFGKEILISGCSHSAKFTLTPPIQVGVATPLPVYNVCILVRKKWIPSDESRRASPLQDLARFIPKKKDTGRIS